MSSILKEELRQERPFASVEEEVFLSIQLTARILLEPWAKFLKTQASLTPVQYNLLRILRGAQGKGRTCGEISERLVTRDPDVTRIVDRLETRGLVRRERDTRDRRVVKIFVTQEGLRHLKRLDKIVDQMPRKVLGPLGARKLRELRDLLNEARTKVGEFP